MPEHMKAFFKKLGDDQKENLSEASRRYSFNFEEGKPALD
jgi:hypothetical protein